jgi:hypothetical protein
MSKRRQMNDERDFAGLREWLDHQYHPGRVWPMTGGVRRGGRAKPAGYALFLLGALLLAGALLAALIALLDSAGRVPTDWTPIVFLGVVGALQLAFGVRMLGRQRTQARPNRRRTGVGMTHGQRKRGAG